MMNSNQEALVKTINTKISIDSLRMESSFIKHCKLMFMKQFKDYLKMIKKSPMINCFNNSSRNAVRKSLVILEDFLKNQIPKKNLRKSY